jgi:hypothetical protein
MSIPLEIKWPTAIWEILKEKAMSTHNIYSYKIAKYVLWVSSPSGLWSHHNLWKTPAIHIGVVPETAN